MTSAAVIDSDATVTPLPGAGAAGASGRSARRGRVAGVHRAIDRLAVADLAEGEHATVLKDLERAKRRLHSAALKVLAAAEKARVGERSGHYTECAAVGCDRPYAWCELHHEDTWADGGRTDLHLAVPLCGYHHRRMHDARFVSEISTDGSGVKTSRLRER